MSLVELPVSVPPFFAEACGYHGGARYVALRWVEDEELWLSDDGQNVRGRAQPVALLWRREGGAAALAHFRAERELRGRPPWLVVDRALKRLLMGHAVDVWRVVCAQPSTVRMAHSRTRRLAIWRRGSRR